MASQVAAGRERGTSSGSDQAGSGGRERAVARQVVVGERERWPVR